MSNSFRREFGAYIRTRFPPWLALSLPLFLTIAAIGQLQPMSVLDFLSAYCLAVLLVFAFRLWDDIADRPRDQQFHPERVLSQTSHIESFGNLVVSLSVLNLCFTDAFEWFFSMKFILSAPARNLTAIYTVLAVWYWLREQLPWMPVLNYHIVLLKYPCFVTILGATSDHTVTASLFNQATVVYLSMCVFEVLHDRELRQFGVARVMAFVEFVLAMLLIFTVH